MKTLAEQQEALVASIVGRGDVPGLVPLPAVAHGKQAYRGNAQGLAAKALGSVFGELREVFGDEEFAAMAWAFWRAAPPRSGDLGDWGGELAGFLAAQPGMDLGLVDQARLEWAKHEAERAADAAFDAESLGLLAGEGVVGLRLRPGTALLDQSTGAVLVWRQGWRAQWRAVQLDEAGFVRALLEGCPLAQALPEDFDFTSWLQTALREGWLLGALSLEKD